MLITIKEIIVDIILISDKNYFDFMIVTIESLLNTTTEKINIKVILTFELEEKLLNLEKQINEKYNYANVTFIYFDESKIKSIKSKNHVSVAAYIKVFLPELFPNIDKAIFLDSDLLIRKNIKELWKLWDTEDFTLGAVVNPGYIQDNKIFDLEETEITFNSGVMMMNLKNMRKENTSKQLLNFIEKYNDVTYLNDQAAFNAVFKKRWKQLPIQWNVQYVFYIRPFSYFKIEKANVVQAVNNPAIVHFTSKSKPWHKYNVHPVKEEYRRKLVRYYSNEESSKSVIKKIYSIHDSFVVKTRIDLVWLIKRKFKLYKLKQRMNQRS